MFLSGFSGVKINFTQKISRPISLLTELQTWYRPLPRNL